MASQESLVDLEVVKTDTKTITLSIKDADDVAIDITGYTVFFTVKTSVNDSDANALISKTTVCPTNTDSTNGIAYIILSSADTTIAIGNFYYDIKIQKNSGQTILWRKTVAMGKFKVNLTATTRIG